ncbi:unnamed protein product [Moneuplotes crassus]|uniref:Uncharacterized protein n=1 Tax=Euplotes crassus TaxID=5936 RepID=A0AAD1X710_EUPCR|nr:unnamed protein product [Moneuplotes crassus]
MEKNSEDCSAHLQFDGADVKNSSCSEDYFPLQNFKNRLESKSSHKLTKKKKKSSEIGFYNNQNEDNSNSLLPKSIERREASSPECIKKDNFNELPKLGSSSSLLFSEKKMGKMLKINLKKISKQEIENKKKILENLFNSNYDDGTNSKKVKPYLRQSHSEYSASRDNGMHGDQYNDRGSMKANHIYQSARNIVESSKINKIKNSRNLHISYNRGVHKKGSQHSTNPNKNT